MVLFVHVFIAFICLPEFWTQTLPDSVLGGSPKPSLLHHTPTTTTPQVEQFVVASPAPGASDAELDAMLATAEGFYESLGLAFQVGGRMYIWARFLSCFY